jgi:hypothetical protein
MKQRIFIYLFIFSVLVILFQYVNSKRIIDLLNNKVTAKEEQVISYKDSITALSNQIVHGSHFNLEHNEDAISYFEAKGFDVDRLIPFIKDELYKTNEASGDHPLVPYAASSGRKMMINTVKLLNHKWIIADFSDGVFWGELFLSYQVDAQDVVTFEVAASFLYPFN